MMMIIIIIIFKAQITLVVTKHDSGKWRWHGEAELEVFWTERTEAGDQ